MASDLTHAPGEDLGPVVRDRQVQPRGVLSQHVKMYLLLAVAGVMVVVIATSEHSAPPTPVATQAAQVEPIQNPARVASYADRLRNLAPDMADSAATGRQDPPTPLPAHEVYANAGAPAVVDDIERDRKKRDYDSLFASSLVASRRTEPGVLGGTAAAPFRPGDDRPLPPPPTLDEVAQAVARATGRAASVSPSTSEAPASPVPTARQPPPRTGHRVYEGTVINGVLSNRLEGSMAGPVNVLVSTPVYSHDLALVIPSGSRVLGSAKRVEAQGETRLAVAFHRLVLPDGRDVSLDAFVGMNRLGDVGLKDKVNNHYLATFGASAAVGLVAGFSQWAGTGFSRNQGGSGSTVVIAGNVSDAASQATAQAMNRFLNRLPTITIREGHRVAVYLTSDLTLPAYRGEP